MKRDSGVVGIRLKLKKEISCGLWGTTWYSWGIYFSHEKVFHFLERSGKIRGIVQSSLTSLWDKVGNSTSLWGQISLTKENNGSRSVGHSTQTKLR